ncbi:MAG: STAS domain-containing protein [Nitrospira sp.]|nr:STAS domain-containing protein [Nitrospira sp.]
MEVSTRRDGGHVHVTVAGRLDAHGADRLAVELEAAVTHGARHLLLDLSDLEFISSAGLRILLRFYKQLKGLHGSFVVADCSAPVKMVIALAGFEQLLGLGCVSSDAGAPATRAAPSAPGAGTVELETAVYEKFELDLGATLACQLVGGEGLARQAPLSEADCRTMQFPAGTIALGIGALGQEASACRDRFGEFLAVAGAVAYHPTDPTDGADVPDYMVQSGAFLPDVHVLCCLLCEGSFAHQLRFEAKPDAGFLPLDRLVKSCLDLTHSDAAGIVVLAETGRVVGTALTRSPAGGAGDWREASRAPCRLPRSTVLVAGIVAREDRPALEGLVQPLGRQAWPCGWLHAAVFSFCPLRTGRVDLQEAAGSLFESERLLGLLQLSGGRDGAPEAGASEFIRGASWVGPLGPIQSERGRR